MRDSENGTSRGGRRGGSRAGGRCTEEASLKRAKPWDRAATICEDTKAPLGWERETEGKTWKAPPSNWRFNGVLWALVSDSTLGGPGNNNNIHAQKLEADQDRLERAQNAKQAEEGIPPKDLPTHSEPTPEPTKSTSKPESTMRPSTTRT